MTLSHVNKAGKASMVDVSGKELTERIASARVRVKLNAEAFEAVSENKIKKAMFLLSQISPESMRQKRHRN